jgi:hypothetical protein
MEKNETKIETEEKLITKEELFQEIANNIKETSENTKTIKTYIQFFFFFFVIGIIIAICSIGSILNNVPN